MRLLVALALAGTLGPRPGFAQTPTSPTFEAASVKPNTGPSSGNGTVRLLPGRVRAENALVRFLIQNAYGVKPFEIAGGPSWIDRERYDVEAEAAGDPGDRVILRMLQSLLEQRFHLQVHHQTREAPVYILHAAKGGLKVTAPKDGDCVTTGQDQPPVAPGPGLTGAQPCGRLMVRIKMPNAQMTGAQVQMADVARVLANLLWRPVLDRTGYSGKFNLTVEFAADHAIGLLSGPYRPDAAPPAPLEPGGVSVFTALQEEAGLKLEAGKGPVDVLVIDRIEKPSAN